MCSHIRPNGALAITRHACGLRLQSIWADKAISVAGVLLVSRLVYWHVSQLCRFTEKEQAVEKANDRKEKTNPLARCASKKVACPPPVCTSAKAILRRWQTGVDKTRHQKRARIGASLVNAAVDFLREYGLRYYENMSTLFMQGGDSVHSMARALSASASKPFHA